MLFPSILFGQTETFTYNDYQQEKNLSQKAYIAYVLYDVYLRNDLDSALVISKDLLAHNEIENNDYAFGIGKLVLGTYQFRSGKVNEGILNLRIAEKIFKQLENYEELTEVLSSLGNAHVYKGEPSNAIPFYQSSIKYGKLSPNKSTSYIAYINLAIALKNMNQLDEAEKNANIYLALAEKYNKKEAMGTAISTLANIEDLRGNKEKATEYLKKSILLYYDGGSKNQQASAYNNLAINNFTNGLMDEAESNFLKGLELRLEIKNVHMVSESYYNLGEFYAISKKYDQSIENYIYAYDVAQEGGFLQEAGDAALALAELYKELNNTEKSLEYYKVYSELLVKQKDKMNAELLNNPILEDNIRNEMSIKRMQKRELSLIDQLYNEKRNKWLLAGLCIAITVLAILLLSRKKKTV